MGCLRRISDNLPLDGTLRKQHRRGILLAAPLQACVSGMPRAEAFTFDALQAFVDI